MSLLASEVATLKYVGAHSTIPVPEVFAYRQGNFYRPATHAYCCAAAHGKMTSVSLISL